MTFASSKQLILKIILATIFVLVGVFASSSAQAETKTDPTKPASTTTTKPATTKPATTTTDPTTRTPSTPVDTTKPTEGNKGGFVICGNNADQPCNISHLFAAFIIIINYLIAMAGFVAVAAIVFAGFKMIYSQGQDGLKDAKGRFAGAIIGLILVAGAYILINSLFTGRFSLGVCEGHSILTSPVDYINNFETCKKVEPK